MPDEYCGLKRRAHEAPEVRGDLTAAAEHRFNAATFATSSRGLRARSIFSRAVVTNAARTMTCASGRTVEQVKQADCTAAQ